MKKIILGIMLIVSACTYFKAEYSKEEIVLLENNISTLKKEFIGKFVYVCDDESDLSNKLIIKDIEGNLISSRYPSYKLILAKDKDKDCSRNYCTYGNSCCIYGHYWGNAFNLSKLKDSLTVPKFINEKFCSKEEFYNTKLGKKFAYLDKIEENPEEWLLETKDPKVILGKYLIIDRLTGQTLFDLNFVDSFYLSKIFDGDDEYYLNKYNIQLDVSKIQRLAKTTQMLKCFVKYRKDDFDGLLDYKDKTDECILTRRNSILGEWFNYKKYLPQIKSDEHFKNVINMFVTYYDAKVKNDTEFVVENSYCLNKKEITTEERNQCMKNTDTFFNQVLTGNAPHCRNKNRKEWEKFLSLEAYTNNILSKAHVSAFYSSQKQINDFGRDNFCIIDGWEKDLKKFIKK